MYATHDNAATARPDYPTADEIRFHMARARTMRSEATSDALRWLGGRLWRGARPAVTAGRRWSDRWATTRGLMALSDRSLDDLGIRREAIPHLARGVDASGVDLERSWWRGRWQALAAGYEGWQERRRRRERLVRELSAYSDNDLAELQIPRVDIPRFANSIA